MSIDWAALGLVSAVSLAVGVIVVALFALGTVGLAARRQTLGGRDDGRDPALGAASGAVVAGACFAAVVAILVYGLFLIAS